MTFIFWLASAFATTTDEAPYQTVAAPIAHEMLVRHVRRHLGGFATALPSLYYQDLSGPPFVSVGLRSEPFLTQHQERCEAFGQYRCRPAEACYVTMHVNCDGPEGSTSKKLAYRSFER